MRRKFIGFCKKHIVQALMGCVLLCYGAMLIWRSGACTRQAPLLEDYDGERDALAGFSVAFALQDDVHTSAYLLKDGALHTGTALTEPWEIYTAQNTNNSMEDWRDYQVHSDFQPYGTAPIQRAEDGLQHMLTQQAELYLELMIKDDYEVWRRAARVPAGIRLHAAPGEVFSFTRFATTDPWYCQAQAVEQPVRCCAVYGDCLYFFADLPLGSGKGAERAGNALLYCMDLETESARVIGEIPFAGVLENGTQLVQAGKRPVLVQAYQDGLQIQVYARDGRLLGSDFFEQTEGFSDYNVFLNPDNENDMLCIVGNKGVLIEQMQQDGSLSRHAFLPIDFSSGQPDYAAWSDGRLLVITEEADGPVWSWPDAQQDGKPLQYAVVTRWLRVYEQSADHSAQLLYAGALRGGWSEDRKRTLNQRFWQDTKMLRGESFARFFTASQWRGGSTR